MKMTRETLRSYLDNDELMQAINIKCELDKSKNVPGHTKISRDYESMIETIWGVTPQMSDILCRYSECNRLPNLVWA